MFVVLGLIAATAGGLGVVLGCATSLPWITAAEHANKYAHDFFTVFWRMISADADPKLLPSTVSGIDVSGSGEGLSRIPGAPPAPEPTIQSGPRVPSQEDRDEFYRKNKDSMKPLIDAFPILLSVYFAPWLADELRNILPSLLPDAIPQALQPLMDDIYTKADLRTNIRTRQKGGGHKATRTISRISGPAMAGSRSAFNSRLNSTNPSRRQTGQDAPPPPEQPRRGVTFSSGGLSESPVDVRRGSPQGRTP